MIKISKYRKNVLSDIEHDGRFVTTSRDPPGQRCVYIPPGNTEREAYRISTFKEFPLYSIINVCAFALNGFFFTGYKDRIKCFSCSQIAENWQVGDDPSSREWHKPDCAFALGRDNTNIPLETPFRNTTMQYTRRNNLNFHRELPHVQTDSSISVLQPTSSNYFSPSVFQGGRTSPLTRSVNTASGSQQSNSEDTPTTSSAACARPKSRNEESINSTTFPCLHPINPHMRRTEARLQTFIDNSRLWPSYRLRATPEEIADAGMYFLGERDRVKCWYCNGGLQNWERDDDPWVEHAKWFPMCEYLLQRKGPDFIHRIVAQYPNLRRPILRNPAPTSSAQNVVAEMNSSTIILSNNHQSVPSHSPVIIDPREELRKKEVMIEKEMTASDLVRQVRSMGFNNDVIKAALSRKLETSNQFFSNMEGFVESLISFENTVPHRNEESSSSVDRTDSLENMTPSEGVEEMRRLEESRNCKSCHSNRACMVFIPCGHLACCAECGSDVERCPICNCHVQERIKTFIV